MTIREWFNVQLWGNKEGHYPSQAKAIKQAEADEAIDWEELKKRNDALAFGCNHSFFITGIFNQYHKCRNCGYTKSNPDL